MTQKNHIIFKPVLWNGLLKRTDSQNRIRLPTTGRWALQDQEPFQPTHYTAVINSAYMQLYDKTRFIHKA